MMKWLKTFEKLQIQRIAQIYQSVEILEKKKKFLRKNYRKCSVIELEVVPTKK